MADPTVHGTIEVRELITETSVSELERSKGRYAQLFGKPPDLEPFEGDIEWCLGGGWVQISNGEVKP